MPIHHVHDKFLDDFANIGGYAGSNRVGIEYAVEGVYF